MTTLLTATLHSLKAVNSSPLDKIALFLNNYSQRHAHVEGHTDDVGTYDANMLLPQRWAETAKAFLVVRGVADNRASVSAKARAHHWPLIPGH